MRRMRSLSNFANTERTLCSCSSRVRNSSLHRFAQLAEVRSAHRPAHGHEHVRAGLDEHPFIHGHENFAV